MRASISLGRWFGVPIGLHYSWFIIAWLITLSLTAQFNALQRGWSDETIWTLAIGTAVLFFVSIVLHELAHATVARANGINVRSITLFALGGIANIENEAASPSTEFWMAIAGPAASLGIGLACVAVTYAIGRVSPEASRSSIAAMLGWLGYINIALAVFNLLPAFPLDGGRVLRSIVWAVTHNADRATRLAARAGLVIGCLLIAGGFISMVVSSDFGGLWTAFIGWFLVEGARAYEMQLDLEAALRGMRVADVMAHECASVDENTTVRQFVEQQLTKTGGRCFAVSRGDHLVGLIAAEDVKHVDRSRWDRTTVSQAMRPLQTLHALTPDAPARDALAMMGREHVSQLPVLSNGGHFEGVVTRSYLMHLLQVRRQLEA